MKTFLRTPKNIFLIFLISYISFLVIDFIQKSYEGLDLKELIFRKIYNPKESINEDYFDSNFKFDEYKSKINLIYKRPSFLRNNLYKKVILPRSIIDLTEIQINDSKKLLKTKLYGINTSSILTSSKDKSSRCLRIYIQGHRGNPFNFSAHNKILKWSNENGCDFLSMSMLGLGLNEGESNFPVKNKAWKLSKVQSKSHANYMNYKDINYPNIDAITLFLTPHYFTIKSIIDNYEEVDILGISGGGWYAVWLASLIPEIGKSISIAGTLPYEYQIYFSNRGDWEQNMSEIYKEITYWELYALMTISEDNELRKSYLIYNDKDPCCFSEPYISHLKSKFNDLNQKLPKIIIDKNKFHSINTDLIYRLLKLN